MEGPHRNHQKKTRKMNNNNNITSNVDRLSLLPDYILVDIISLLPLIVAVRTSVLSHRWRHLWTYITRIDVNCFGSRVWPSYVDPYSFQAFTFLFTHILPKLNSPKINSFHLRCPGPSVGHENIQCSSYFSLWVPLICSRKPRKFKVMFHNFIGFIQMPMCIFQCPSLVKLQLSGNFRVMLPGSISLPNLKNLDMRRLDIDLKFYSQIIRSCPSLENLYLELKLSENDLVLDISGKNLKFLGVFIRKSSRQSKILIDAPNLEGIGLQGCFVTYRFVHKLSGIKSATIRFWDFTEQDEYQSEISQLVGGICNVRSLVILDNLAVLNPLEHLHPDVFEKFANLTELSLTYVSAQQVNRTAPLPVCLLHRLNSIELHEINGDAKDLMLVKFILRRAKVLKTLIIEICHHGGNDLENLWLEYMFCDKLFLMPTSSKSCFIQFDGLFITASSNGYQDGSLSCKVNYHFFGVNEIEEVPDFSENSE